MPKRNERLFWVKSEQVTGSASRKVARTFEEFSKSNGCRFYNCVETEAASERLWLVILLSGDRKDAPMFSKILYQHLVSIQKEYQIPLKRQVNLPQPLIRPRMGPWPWTDIGLHPVNQDWNGTLTTITYYEGRYYQPPHLQLSEVKDVYERINKAWAEIKCECHMGSKCKCGDMGCFDCFVLDCSSCHGTGWKDYSRWINGGCKINYSTGFPYPAFQ